MAVSMASLLDGLAGIAYVVDHHGVIDAVGAPHWRAFAAANGADTLADEGSVLGRSLFDFSEGDRVAEIYHRCLDLVFAARIPGARLASRCDGPGVRRELSITVTPIPGGGGGVERALFQSVTIAEEERPPIDLFDFTGIARRGAGQAWPILAMCSYCQAVRYPLGVPAAEVAEDWISAEDYYHRGGHARVRLSHGVCPPCFEELDRALPH